MKRHLRLLTAGLLAALFLFACDTGVNPSSDPAATAPAVPTGLSVGSATESTLTVSWTASAGATGYEVYRDSGSDGAFTNKVYDGADVSFTDTGLVSCTEYWYKVSAVNSAGSSEYSGAIAGTTTLGTPEPLVGSASQTTLTISWLPINGADSYEIIYHGGVVGPTTISTNATSPFIHTGLTASTNYYYIVQAENATEFHDSDWIPGRTLDPAPPSAPAGVTISDPTATSLAVSWPAVTDATSYMVYRGDSAGGSYTTKIFEGTARSFINSGLAGSTTYYYEVEAYIGVTPGDRSVVASGTTGTGPVTSTYTLEQLANNAGGAFGAINSSTNIGGGQSITMTQSITLDSFALYLVPLSTPSQDFTLRLDVRNSDGEIIATNVKTVSSHPEGWFVWDSFGSLTLASGSSYIFTAYVLDAMTNSGYFSLRGDQYESYIEGQRYSSGISGTNLNLEAWSHEGVIGAGPNAGDPYTEYHYNTKVWDLMFQLKGH